MPESKPAQRRKEAPDERHTGPLTERRLNRHPVPLFAEVRRALDDLWDTLGGESAEYDLPNIRSLTNVNPQLGRIIKRAGLEVWPKRWQNLRATRATELERMFATHNVTRWCGHTERIAKQHYWMTTEEDYKKAASLESVSPGAQQDTESGSTTSQREMLAQEKSPEIPGFADTCDDLRRLRVEDNGTSHDKPQVLNNKAFAAIVKSRIRHRNRHFRHSAVGAC